jgi:hypothetical protein
MLKYGILEGEEKMALTVAFVRKGCLRSNRIKSRISIIGPRRLIQK